MRAIVREGTDCTIVALAAMVPRAAEAAERLAADHGISAEVIDLRTLVPLDVADHPRVGREDEPACSPSRRTRACAAGAPRSCRSWPTRASGRLDAPLVRITTPHVPLPSAPALEDLAMPSVDRIADTVRRQARGGALTMTRVGVLGTGRMGSAIARALARDGHEVVLWNRTLERRYALAGQLGAGVRVAGNAAEVAANTDVTIIDGRRRPRRRRRSTKARTASSRGRTRAACWST